MRVGLSRDDTGGVLSRSTDECRPWTCLRGIVNGVRSNDPAQAKVMERGPFGIGPGVPIALGRWPLWQVIATALVAGIWVVNRLMCNVVYTIQME